MPADAPMPPSIIVPADCLAAISGTVNGRCTLVFNVRTDDSLKFLNLFVDCYRAERAAAEQTAADEADRWEWG